MERRRSRHLAATDVQDLTGMRYEDAHTVLRRWEADGVSWDEGIEMLAAEANEREDAAESASC